ncbi:MAG: cyclic nucleotide-binding domain-containing protein [Deltaproteobacteria bacterium]|nr:cyclic nucleotide-binding domain-containing protein [Deltaproteobacteria bacterium]
MATLADEIRTRKDRAIDLLGRGKREAAIVELERVVALAPDDVFARQKLADVLVRVGRKADAVTHYSALVGRWAAEGHHLKAIAMAHVILQVDPLHVETQRALGQLLGRRDSNAPSALPTLPKSMTAAFTQPSPAEPPPVDAALAKIPLFSDLDPASFVDLLPRLERRAVQEGEIIVSEGDPGDAMFAVVRGTVRVQRCFDDGVRKIADMGEGTFFGEMALVADVPRFADVVAVTEGELLVIRRGALEELVALHPPVREVLLRFHQARLLTNLLRAAPMFVSVPEADRQRLMGATTVRSFQTGDEIVRQGAPVEGLHVVLRGACEVEHTGGAQLPPMDEGDVFGEIALIAEAHATATVRAASPAVVLVIERTVAKALLQHEPVLVALSALGRQRLERTRRFSAVV